jgi:hypothetical protein
VYDAIREHRVKDRPFSDAARNCFRPRVFRVLVILQVLCIAVGLSSAQTQPANGGWPQKVEDLLKVFAIRIRVQSSVIVAGRQRDQGAVVSWLVRQDSGCLFGSS